MTLFLDRARRSLQALFPEYDIMPKGTAERLRQAEEAEAVLCYIAAALQRYHLESKPKRGIGCFGVELP